jgi:Protein of unknown function.
MYKERDGTYHPIEGKPIGHYEDSLRSADEPSDVSESAVELSAHDALGRSNVEDYDVDEEEWVQWYPSESSEAHGFATSVDGDTVTVEKWSQTSDGTWKTNGNTVEKKMEALEPWGNFPRKQEEFADEIEDGDPRKKPAQGSERKEGSDENPEDSAASMSVESLEEADIEFSESITNGLKNKKEEHNEEHGDEEGKKVTLTMLKKVFRRGAGAYSDSHREGMTRNQWSYARVNAFLYLVRNGNPENDAYKQDNDLLPEEHPKHNADAGGDEEQSAGGYGEPAELAATDGLDETYSKWDEMTNMTASEMEKWDDHACSDEASLDPQKVRDRNLMLLETDKSDWGEDEMEAAERTISFLSRMDNEENEPDDPRDGPHGCPSEWAISLMNWAHNPFDEIPDEPDSEELNGDGHGGSLEYEAANGAVWFEVPKMGSTVTTPVAFVTGSYDFNVESSDNPPKQGHGHLHVLVNTEFVEPGEMTPMEDGYIHLGGGETKFELDLPPGQHTLRLQAADANHYAYDIKDEMEITVIDPDQISMEENSMMDNDADMSDMPRSNYGDTPSWQEGDMVQWQVQPDLFGRIVHVDEDKHVAMVEIMGMDDGNMVSTGFTITAGFSDIRPMQMMMKDTDSGLSYNSDDADDDAGMMDHKSGHDADDDAGMMDMDAGLAMAKAKDDLYEDPVSAKDRADEIGCIGIHQHDIEGQEMHMPCQSHDQYEETSRRAWQPTLPAMQQNWRWSMVWISPALFGGTTRWALSPSS